MKKKILILLFGILMLLSACGTQAQPSESVERSDNAAEVTKEHIEETIETVKTPMLTEDIESVEAVEEVIPEEEFDLSVAQIEVDQQCWQASIDQRLVRSLYSKNAYRRVGILGVIF